MDVDGPGAISSPGTEEETIARKRSRRVSFADTTAVHVFDRDEDFETPPDSSASLSPSPGRSSAEANDGNDTSYAGSPAPPIFFLPDNDSSSPGSAAGSVVSADDGNFFGPVSTSFIQIGRPSDAGMSEDGDHDITLDSRTFSRHFLNVAPPEECTANSVGSLRTPDTASKGPIEESNVSEPGRKSSSGLDALTDMSMFTGNPRTYGYGKLSPMLNDVMQKIEQGGQRNSPIAAISDTSAQLSSADPVICLNSAEQLHQQNEVRDTESILRTPRTVVQQLEFPPGSILSVHSQGQELFSSTPLSNYAVACQEHLSVEQRLSALENLLKLKHRESSPVSRFSLVERTELGIQANDISVRSEDHAPTLSVPCNSVPSRQLKRTGESVNPGNPPGQGLNEAANAHSTSCDVLTLDSELGRECNSHLDLDGGGTNRTVKYDSHAVHECPVETSKAARSPKKSRKQLTTASELSVSPKVYEEKQSGDNFREQSVNVDWNKVVSTISNATEQVLAASISKINLQQLNTIREKLDDFQMARKYRRLSKAVRVENCCGDQQKRLAEAQSLHERLLHEKAKLQINNMKLAELRNKSQQCQIGIHECSFLKNKILGAAQMNNASRHGTSLICSSDSKEQLAVVSKKMLEYNIIQQKLESLKSSLEYFRNNKADISCQSVMESAEEQLDMRNQCRIIHQQAEFPEMMDVVKRDSKCEVILNYRNLLFQRIIINIGDTSGIFVNNSLNGTKIGQAFPDLDASVAFNYIFKAEQNQSVSDLQSLQKRTMETCMLLGNLVDVLDEIEFAKVKLLNLTSAAFVLESHTCQLALRLCFLSFKNGKSIGFTIDMTDLNCAVYPSEPSELLIKLCQAQTTLSQPSIEEIMVSIRNLQPGRMVILRLCRMVSQLIQ
ncbi:hypothetical protein QOZ80_6BG0498150 [Eleusine coracana subsp. coracana]|nr:hypothetical protein QOZ80_6BG0498150 [Eleusine coracana subsp. coracana]